jgi:DNA-directed RNA polymerase specialized sigma24 family protein
MKNKESKSQKSRRRESATKPSAVPSEKATTGSAPHSTEPSVNCDEFFLAQLEEIYRTTRKQRIAALRCNGIQDPEAAFHDAVLTILRCNSWSPKAAAYLLKRLKDRTYTAIKCHIRMQKRFEDVPEEFWLRIQADDSPTSDDDARLELAYLFPRLGGFNKQILIWACLEGRTMKEIAALTGRPTGTIKSAISRAREKARKIRVKFRAIDEEGPQPL